MYTPHTVTIFNAYKEGGRTNYQATTINGVFKQSVKASAIGTEGMKKSGTAKLFIPFTANIKDGRTYISATKFAQLKASDRKQHFTLSENGDFFVLGSVTPTSDAVRYEDYRTDDEGAHRILQVNCCDYGSEELQHWEVNGE
jgi:stage V sporulation protein SpoVS